MSHPLYVAAERRLTQLQAEAHELTAQRKRMEEEHAALRCVSQGEFLIEVAWVFNSYRARLKGCAAYDGWGLAPGAAVADLCQKITDGKQETKP